MQFLEMIAALPPCYLQLPYTVPVVSGLQYSLSLCSKTELLSPLSCQPHSPMCQFSVQGQSGFMGKFTFDFIVPGLTMNE